MANLGVCRENKTAIAECGGIDPLIALTATASASVKIEAIAALANLAVDGTPRCTRNATRTCVRHLPPLARDVRALTRVCVGCADSNEAEIGAKGGIAHIVATAAAITGTSDVDVELQSQCARALRNLSVAPANKLLVRAADGIPVLRKLAESASDRTKQQALRALNNLASVMPAESSPLVGASSALAASMP